MNLSLIHGGDSVRSHQKILEIKKRFDKLSIVECRGETLDSKSLGETVRSSSFFSSQRLILVENPPVNFKLSELPIVEDVSLVFIFPKDLTISCEILEDANSLHASIFYFPKRLPVNIFAYLDLVAEKKKDAIVRLDQVYNEYGAQYLITMLVYSLRRLILSSNKQLPLEKIKTLYELILETDFKIKSGMIDEKLALSLLIQNFLL